MSINTQPNPVVTQRSSEDRNPLTENTAPWDSTAAEVQSDDVDGPGTSAAGAAVATGTTGAGNVGSARPRSVALKTVLANKWLAAGLGLIVPVILLVLWNTLSSNGTFSPIQLPQPTTVLAAGIELVQRGDLWTHIAISTQRVVLGFLIGSTLGLTLGALIGLSRWSSVLAGPTIGALRAVPSLAWVPLLLLWIGIGENSKVTLVAIGAFFPVYTTVSAALKHVDHHLLEAARSFGVTGIQLFFQVQLPAVLPSVVSGLRLALAQAWLFLVAAELLGSSMGLGFLLTDSQNNGRTDRLLLAILLLAVLGKLTDALLGVFERWTARRWGAVARA